MTGIQLSDPLGNPIPLILQILERGARLDLAICSTYDGQPWEAPFIQEFPEGDWPNGQFWPQVSGNWTIRTESVDFPALVIDIQNSWLKAVFYMKRADWDSYWQLVRGFG